MSAAEFSWQPSPQQLFCFRNIFWTRNAATILMDDSLTNIDLLSLRFCISAKRLNQTTSAWIGTSLVKPLIAGDTTDFRFFLPKSKNAVFKYRPVALLNISVFGLLAEWDRRLLRYRQNVGSSSSGMMGRIAGRNFLPELCTFAATLPSRRFGPTLILAKFKAELLTWKRPNDYCCSEEFYS